MADQCWDVKLLEVKGKVTPSGEASKHPASNRSSNSMRSHTQHHDPSTACARHLGSRNNSEVDLYRVKFEVNNLKPFACLAFPHTTYLKTPRKQPIFGDELATSFLFLRRKAFSAPFRSSRRSGSYRMAARNRNAECGQSKDIPLGGRCSGFETPVPEPSFVDFASPGRFSLRPRRCVLALSTDSRHPRVVCVEAASGLKSN